MSLSARSPPDRRTPPDAPVEGLERLAAAAWGEPVAPPTGIFTAVAGAYVIGSTSTPLVRASQCTCAPVETPLEPTDAIGCPATTRSPSSTFVAERGYSQTSRPQSSRAHTDRPPGPRQPTSVTVPESLATTGDPYGAAMSIPVCP